MHLWALVKYMKYDKLCSSNIWHFLHKWHTIHAVSERWWGTTHIASLPLIKELRPNLVTKILSNSSLPVNSSATTYKSARSFLAVSSMYCKKHSQGSHRKGKGRTEKKKGYKARHGLGSREVPCSRDKMESQNTKKPNKFNYTKVKLKKPNQE